MPRRPLPSFPPPYKGAGTPSLQARRGFPIGDQPCVANILQRGWFAKVHSCGLTTKTCLPAANALPASSSWPHAVSPSLQTNKHTSASLASAMHLRQCSCHWSALASLRSTLGGQSIHDAASGRGGRVSFGRLRHFHGVEISCESAASGTATLPFLALLRFTSIAVCDWDIEARSR